MKVKVIKSYKGKEGWCLAGTILTVDKERAKELIDSGRAKRTRETKKTLEKEAKIIGPTEKK